jgi:hypothetical protein
MKRLIMTLAILVFFNSGVMADIVIFKSGGSKEGIIEEETPSSVKLRIRGAVIGFARSNIEWIEYASDQENAKLDDKWLEEEKEQEEERKRKREEEKKFEKRQLEKGLIKVGDEWVTRRKKAELQQEELRNRIQEQKDEQELAAQEAALAAEEEAEEEEEEEIEENPLTRDIEKISLGKPSVKRVGVDSAVFVSRIKNNGELAAESIYVDIFIYDKEGVLIYADTEEVPDLGGGQSRELNIALDVDPREIGKTEASVMGVVWTTF